LDLKKRSSTPTSARVKPEIPEEDPPVVVFESTDVISPEELELESYPLASGEASPRGCGCESSRTVTATWSRVDKAPAGNRAQPSLTAPDTKKSRPRVLTRSLASAPVAESKHHQCGAE
jgi:hypothetical protein